MDTGGEHKEYDHLVVPALAALAPLTAPTAGERARIRERVLAGLAETAEPETSHPVAEAEDTESAATRAATSTVTDAVGTATTDRVRPTPHRAVSGRVARASRGPRGRRDSTRGGERDELPVGPARPMSGARARFAIAAVAVLALVGSLTGMSLLLSRDALPGDALYGFKRTAEAASLGLTFGEESKALKHLDFASARISEIETLARRYPDADGAPTGSYLTALTDFDNDAAAGSRQLIALADSGQLELLGTWASQHESRLTEVVLPPTVRAREAASIDLLGQIAGRAQALLARMGCQQVTSGSFDEVGALPATGRCDRAPGAGPGRSLPPSGAPTPTPTPGQVQPTPPPSGAGTPPGDQPPPLLPLPGVETGQPGTGEKSGEAPPAGTGSSPTVELPLPLPGIEVPPLLPGLPGISVGR